MAGQLAIPKAMRPTLGTPPTIEWRAIGDLMIDTSYQRPTDNADASRLIRAIALDWDWRLCAPLTCARRDGALYVIDGQHRLEAARARGDIPHLPCIISTFDGPADEARMFVAVNRSRRGVTHLDGFRAAIAAGDAKALNLSRVIAAGGLKLAKHSNSNVWKPLEISSIKGVQSALNRHGETATIAALADIAHAFPAEPLKYAGRILGGLFPLRAAPPPGFDEARWRRVLAAPGQSGWYAAMLRRQAKHGELPESAMQYAMIDALAQQA